MRDPCLYDDSSVLKNRLGIRDEETLKCAEANYVSLRLRDIALHPLEGDYHTPHLLKMHEEKYHIGEEIQTANDGILIYVGSGLSVGQEKKG